ncbi:MAG: translesion error-prone DNA polymerase V autoproteolytic subunit [Burkholderiales bacterium]|nr:translesion error-prone DNA polymerase V autoproteolytic subunit [Burkholderiales bacterium]
MYSELVLNSPVPLTSLGEPVLAQLLGTARAGFPSPAEDLQEQSIDLVQLLLTHPQATFLIRARGTSMVGVGIYDNDILVVNRALKPRHMDVVVAVVDGEFTIKQLHQTAGRAPRLKAANPTFPDIVPKEGQTLEVWGVVDASIKFHRQRERGR